jgi:carnitine O-palmitoyltransferase 1
MKPSLFNSLLVLKVFNSNFAAINISISSKLGVSVDLSYDVFKALIYSGLRSWKLRCRRTLNSLHNSLYPGHPLRGIACCGIVYTLYTKGYDPSYHIIDWIDSKIFRRYFTAPNSKILACVVFGAGAYFVFIQIRQYALKNLFSYHGWMYQEHGKKMGLIPKLWGVLAKVLVGRNPSLYSCQSILPTLPLPSLDDTLNRYLRTVRPLYNDDEYHRMEVLAEEFKQTIGRKLQRYLWLKWLISINYVLMSESVFNISTSFSICI